MIWFNFEEKYGAVSQSKGNTIIFPLEEPLPVILIVQFVFVVLIFPSRVHEWSFEDQSGYHVLARDCLVQVR